MQFDILARALQHGILQFLQIILAFYDTLQIISYQTNPYLQK
jgi:hypothetical protein